jgi:hypothetical protein
VLGRCWAGAHPTATASHTPRTHELEQQVLQLGVVKVSRHVELQVGWVQLLGDHGRHAIQRERLELLGLGVPVARGAARRRVAWRGV